MDPDQPAPLAVWSGSIVFDPMIKSNLKCFWIYAADLKSIQHFQGENDGVRVFNSLCVKTCSVSLVCISSELLSLKLGPATYFHRVGQLSIKNWKLFFCISLRYKMSEKLHLICKKTNLNDISYLSEMQKNNFQFLWLKIPSLSFLLSI